MRVELFLTDKTTPILFMKILQSIIPRYKLTCKIKLKFLPERCHGNAFYIKLPNIYLIVSPTTPTIL